MEAELNGLKQSALRKRCFEAGMDEEALEDCDDADDTKVSHGAHITIYMGDRCRSYHCGV